MTIPICVRTHNRTAYLHTTLCSVMGTVPPWVPVTVMDDDSDEPEALAYLYGHEPVTINHRYPTDPEWMQYIGELPDVGTVAPVDRERVRVEKSPRRMGVKGSAYWAIRTAFDRLYPEAPACIFLEDDAGCHAKWYEKIVAAWQHGKASIGYVTAYDRHGGVDPAAHKHRKPTGREKQAARILHVSTKRVMQLMEVDHEEKVARRGYRIYRCTADWTFPLAGGVAYLLTRQAYEASYVEYQREIEASELSGDFAVQMNTMAVGLELAALVPSFVQHFGDTSLARPGRYRRYAPNAMLPIGGLFTQGTP